MAKAHGLPVAIPVSASSDIGVNLEAGSNSNTLLTNTINGSGDAAVSVRDSNANRLERNTVDANGDAGLSLSLASSNVLVSNIVRNSSDAAISLQDSHGNTLRSNDVRFNPGGYRSTRRIATAWSRTTHRTRRPRGSR